MAVTGYKPMEMNIFKEDDPRISFVKQALQKRLVSLIENGLEWVLVSGQMGVELWTAEVVLELKEQYEVQLGVIPPFETFAERWPEPLQEKLQMITDQADFYKPLYKGAYVAPYQFRARDVWLADKSDGALILLDEDFPGSTRFFLEVAQNTENYPIQTITPADIDDAVEEMRMTDPDYWT
ncbi:UPF0398 protein [Lentibacillus sp. JNUCC-1]|nr:UPF0398 protein [Lentibacillus sp. JNUCC-1]